KPLVILPPTEFGIIFGYWLAAATTSSVVLAAVSRVGQSHRRVGCFLGSILGIAACIYAGVALSWSIANWHQANMFGRIVEPFWSQKSLLVLGPVAGALLGAVGGSVKSNPDTILDGF